MKRAIRVAYHAHHVFRQPHFRCIVTKSSPSTRRGPDSGQRKPAKQEEHGHPSRTPGSFQYDGLHNTSRVVREACKEHELALPNTTTKLMTPKGADNTFKLAAAYAPWHCFSPMASTYLEQHEHPLTRTILDYYVARKKKQTLWYYVVMKEVGSIKRCVTATAQKRLGHVLREALAAYGYDRDGRRIPTADDDDEEPAVVADLCGTIKVTCHDAKAVCNNRLDVVLEHVKDIVAAAEVELRRDKDGNYLKAPVLGGHKSRKSTRPGVDYKRDKLRKEALRRKQRFPGS